MFIASVTETAMLNAARSADYSYYLEKIKPKPKEVGTTPDGQTIWRCMICGYEYIGEELPDYPMGPLLGEHSEEVIRGLGYSEEEMQALHEAGVYHTWDDLKGAHGY